MEPTLTWLDLTAGDRNKMRRVLDLFSERGTVDEMGLGSLRDALSDELFPGTSSIQTRLRYVLFIPWIYRRLEERRTGSEQVMREARAAELGLIGPLSEGEDTEGIIGARARGSLTRLPSSVYWAGLVRWGIFQHAQSQSWYHTHIAALAHGREGIGRADDPGVVWSRRPNWHPRLPSAPESFPNEASFDLTSEEADFLRGRLEEGGTGSLLAWLAREGASNLAESFWDDPDVLRATDELRSTVELARRFSLHVEGAPLLYNLMLAERRQGEREVESDEERIDQYRAEIAQWAAKETDEAPFDANVLWMFMARRGGRLPDPQRRFVEQWTRQIGEIGATALVDNREVRRQIEAREIQLKGGRARLVNQNRLLDWSGRVGVGRMDFRWFRVRQLLIDLHRGLGA